MSSLKSIAAATRTTTLSAIAAVATVYTLAAAAMVSARAQSAAAKPTATASPVVYRCPGPSVLYTDALTAQEASTRNCTALTDLPVAVSPTPGPGASSPASSPGAPSPASAVPAVPVRTLADDSRSRDAQIRRILEAELQREEARLQDALKAAAMSRPGERTSADAALIRRTESDIEAIRRELERLR